MYHYADGDVSRGPVPLEALRGRINAQTLVWREGMTDWLPAGTLPELASLFGGVPPAEAVMPVATAVPADGWTGNTSAAMAAAVPVPPQNIDYPNRPVGDPPGAAIASMILGIVGVTLMCVYLLGIIPAILAVIFGYIARSQGARGTNPGAAMATAGIVMGWIPIGLFVVGIVVLILVMIVAAIAH